MCLDYQQWIRIENCILKDENYKKDDLLKELESHKSVLRLDAKYFRARLITKSNENKMNKFMSDDKYFGFPASGCGAPNPENEIKPGRCNRENESVLYLAEDKYTALAEVRPGKRQRVNIAEFKLKREARVIDIIYNDSNDPNSLFTWIAFYFYIVYNDNEEYYKITQHIAQIIKEAGYDGIRFSSSLSANGMNIVLFDIESGECLNSKVYQTISLLHYAEEQIPRENNEKLLPRSITNKFSNNQINWFLDQFN